MNRRDLFQRFTATVLAILFPWYRTAKAWPFVAVPRVYMSGFREPESFLEVWDAGTIAHCSVCGECYVEDCNGRDDDVIRKFYRATDGGNCIVCEHCTGEYLKG